MTHEKRLAWLRAWYAKNKLRIRALVARRYENAPDRFAAYQNKYKLAHRKEVAARQTLYRAKKRGVIVPATCVVCGSNKVEAHHPDYKKPLRVIWLCTLHHHELHRKERLNV